MGLAIQELGAAHASKGRNASHPGPNALAGGNRTTAPRRVHSHAELADSLSEELAARLKQLEAGATPPEPAAVRLTIINAVVRACVAPRPPAAGSAAHGGPTRPTSSRDVRFTSNRFRTPRRRENPTRPLEIRSNEGLWKRGRVTRDREFFALEIG
jgi:hypothetical protein